MSCYFDEAISIANLNEKSIYIYGASVSGVSLLKYLDKKRIKVTGFSDVSFSKVGNDIAFFGTPVIDFDVLLNCLDDKTLVFLCCSSEKKAQHYQSVILEKCSEAQCVIINNYDEVYIDISGRCNLRCRSCQVANHHKESFSYSGRGLMSFELFCKILDKVQMELPYCLGVFLFNYGEPLLSPDLPRMIHEIHSRGMIAIISSNLSLEYNFDSLLIDPPDIFKISISGFSQKVYETTHNGGNIYLVKSNMYRIRMIEDKLKTRVNVVVGYHVYNNNQGAEYIAAEDLCKELGFLFQPRKAIFCNIPKQAGIYPFSKSDIEFISEYYPNSRDILTINQSKETISGTCRNALNRLFIDYNGDVFLCFMVMHNGGIYKSYLQTSLKDIRMWQKEHWICGKCKDIGFISLE